MGRGFLAHGHRGATLSLPPPDTWADRLIGELDCALQSLFGEGGQTPPAAPPDERERPERAEPVRRTDVERSAALVRVNLAGELAAQGLYRGQALTARNRSTREQMTAAAEEERLHLEWCRNRLDQLGAAPSLFNPFWYGGALLIGAAAGLAGDRWSLGFVAETERQVEAHLDEQLQRLPEDDLASRRMLQQMREDEIRHGAEAVQAGGKPLPGPVSAAMAAAAALMKFTAARL